MSLCWCPSDESKSGSAGRGWSRSEDEVSPTAIGTASSLDELITRLCSPCLRALSLSETAMEGQASCSTSETSRSGACQEAAYEVIDFYSTVPGAKTVETFVQLMETNAGHHDIIVMNEVSRIIHASCYDAESR